MIEFVSATRLSREEFRESPLGVSLDRVSRDTRIKASIAYQNTDGLPTVYNRRITSKDPSEVLVFVHDDVWIEDFYVSDRLLTALQSFDVVGLAGSKKHIPGQKVWCRSIDGQWYTHLAGAIAHGDAPMGKVGFFGPIVAQVELLDGVFIAARKSTLRKSGVRFDERFDLHFYDMDFCRTATKAGLRLGTFPLAVTHRSNGDFFTAEWDDNYQRYFKKWGD